MIEEEKELSTSNNTIIRDPKIEPFFISKDSYCYTIYKMVTPNAKYTDGGKEGKDYQKAIGHYSNFGNALKALAKQKLNDNQSYNSIKEYLQTFKNLEESLKTLITDID